MNILKALVRAFKVTVLNRKLNKKLLAYGSIITTMKYDCISDKLLSEEWKPNDKYWIGEIPTIYELDLITKEMNKERNDINKTFKLNVSEWDRDEVRYLMDRFEYLYNGYCRVNKKPLTLFETCARIVDVLEMSFWKAFQIFNG